MNTLVNNARKKGLLTRAHRWATRVFLQEKLNNVTGFMTLGLLGLMIGMMVAQGGPKIGFLIISAVIGFPLIFGCLVNVRFGLLFIVGFSYFIYQIRRVTGMYDLQIGVVIEICLLAAMVGVFIRRNIDLTSWRAFRNPITIAVVIYVLFFFLQAFNPNSTNLSGWLFLIRAIISYIALFIISMHAFDSLEFIKKFTKVWFGLALVVAVYGIYQEFVGFTPFEERWIGSFENGWKAILIWGRYRRMSFLSDSATFGIFMAYSAIAGFILALGPYSKRKKMIALISGFLMLMSMTYSGTRTAYAIVPAGIGLFIIMTFNEMRTKVFSLVAIGGMAFILFGPIHAGPLNRVKSLVEMDEDESFNVREDNRARVQPYILQNPLGGGLSTVGTLGERFSPNHPLAGFPPDSQMLKTALEQGWVGLVIEYGINFLVLFVGVQAFFRMKNPVVKNLFLVYVCTYFAVTVANYAQEATGQRPLNLIFFSTMTLIPRLRAFDEEVSVSEKPSI